MTNNIQAITPFVYLIQANQLRQQKAYRQAVEVYTEAVKQIGQTVGLARAIAYCYFNLGFSENQEQENNFQLAIDWIRIAIALDPNNCQLHVDLGDFCSLGMLDYSLAIIEYKTAIKLDHNNTRALIGAASLYGLPDEVIALEEAIEWLTSASRLDPNDPNLHLRLGSLLLESNQSVNTKREFEAALLCPLPLDANATELIKKNIETLG